MEARTPRQSPNQTRHRHPRLERLRTLRPRLTIQNLKKEPAEEPAPAGDIAITLTIGDETWEFPGSLCAFYNAPAGDAGSEWNVSYTQNGLQVYAADDSFGKLLSVADIENGGNPTVSREASHDEVDITVDGNDISATGTFTDNVNGGTVEGTFEAHCNDWFDATG